MKPEHVLTALDWALHYRLEGDFDVELKRWQRESKVEMFGTESLEAGTLADIVRARLRDPRVRQDVIKHLAEIATTPIEHGGAA